MWALFTLWMVALQPRIYVSYYTTQAGCEAAMRAVDQFDVKSAGCTFRDRQNFELV